MDTRSYSVLCDIVLCDIVLCDIVLYDIVLCDIVLCDNVLRSISVMNCGVFENMFICMFVYQICNIMINVVTLRYHGST